MKYLFLEIWVFLLIAFLLGMFVQWFFCCRDKKSELTVKENSLNNDGTSAVIAPSTNTQAEAPVALAEAPVALAEAPVKPVQASMPLVESARPVGFDAMPNDADDIKRIKGIGSVIEKTLNELGIYQFKQIAAWTDENVSWVESSLAFPGRITRENWIEQAKTLSQGGTTEFAKRVDKGSVDYKS